MGLTKVSYAMIDGTPANVRDYGAVGDGVTNDSAAFNAALAANKTVYVPTGTYNIVDKIIVGQLQRQTLFGENSTSTILMSSSTTEPVIYVNSGISGISIRSLTIDRSVVPANNNAAGIDYNRIGEGVLDDLLVQNHYVGLKLGEAGYSRFTNSTIMKNVSHGVVLASAATGQLQWSLINLLSTQNGGSGIVATTQNASATSTSLGEWFKISTFANTGYGIGVLGKVGSGIYGVRISDCFLGQDGNSELYMDTYGGLHKVECSFFELAGTGPTGPTLSTPASNQGYGILVTANNTDVLISGNVSSGQSYSGFDVSSDNSVIVGNYVHNSGLAGSSGDRVGIKIRRGLSLVAGNLSRNTGGSTSQDYGFYKNGDAVTYTGNIAFQNNIADFGGAAAVASNVLGNTGYSINNIIADIYYSGTKIIGPRETGWTAMGGTADKSTSYNTASITLVQLAERVNALQTALTTHGLIGA